MNQTWSNNWRPQTLTIESVMAAIEKCMRIPRYRSIASTTINLRPLREDLMPWDLNEPFDTAVQPGDPLFYTAWFGNFEFLGGPFFFVQGDELLAFQVQQQEDP